MIDKMIASNGWVTNDYEQSMDGRRVFVVVAQTGNSADSASQSWSFYFTELDGKLYSLTTTAPADSFGKADAESQQFLGSLKGATRPTQRLAVSQQ